MIWDNLGLPRPSGADDFNDSAMFAGMLTVFGWPQKIPLKMYVVSKGKYTRHPRESKYKFSRDQTIPLFAGLQRLGLSALVDPDYKTEGDFVSPSIRGHIRRCAGLESTWFQDLSLWSDVFWNIWVKPTAESNQLLCILMLADEKYLKFYTNRNTSWRENITEYWCSWRNEKEFADMIIINIESKI